MVQIITYPMNKVILHRGEQISQVGVVLKGLIRVYDKNNKTVWLVPENNVYGSMETLALQRPSSLTYEALEETTVFLLNYDDLENAIKDHPNIATLLLMYWKSTAMDIYSNFYSFIHLTPEERYLQLIQQNSKLILRVKSKDLATYLGMHPVSLSRLKKRYFNSK
ncbi:Crp/Fnr family transcriptional regulator [Chryseobacterium sp. RP-3-3]|uniref:Crp/Fnr family transcriptional regulator n=1 Tax=Chryseobacterium antibioticum TaxID=2728847 RepID=A0A7Y0FT84_9FLAO|nr:Crp/Fnr family transcriptional regulator [Chryseobacterium antibioticum]NML71565.1 Crp/Fnr family transcriptional regulator [Chryseobacterium antibioticum]